MRIKDARQTFVGVWIRQLMENKPFEVWDGSQLRDFTYVDDAVDALLMAAGSDAVGGHVFNLGGDCVISLKDLADLLIEIHGGGEYVLRPFPSNRKQIDIGNYYADFSRIRAGATVGMAAAKVTAIDRRRIVNHSFHDLR